LKTHGFGGLIDSHGILRGFICEPILNDFQWLPDVVADATGEFAASRYEKGASLPSTLNDDLVARKHVTTSQNRI